jgi:hypothetical protein
MTAATTTRGKQIILNLSPKVAYAVNYGGQDDPHGEVHFLADTNLVVGFAKGRVWRKRGGFGIREEHLRASYNYLRDIDLRGYTRFTTARVGKPS